MSPPAPTFANRMLGMLVWAATIFVALTMATAGFGKFGSADFWQPSFVAWGYPAWLTTFVGLIEIIGAVALLFRRWVVYAAGTLIVVMLGAEFTVLTNETSLGTWQPLMYLALLSFILAYRLSRQRIS